MRSIRRIALAILVVAAPYLAAAADGGDATALLRQAAKKYAEALSKGDFAAVADQWTSNASLTEGGGTIRGRDRIVESLKRWRERHPNATLAIEVTDVELLGETAARVRGRMLFTPKPGEKPHASSFESLRVDEKGTWRIAESQVGPSARALLGELSWMLGTWQATDSKAGTSFESRFEKVLEGRAILGRTTIRPKQGDVIESIELIHADSRDGVVRCWVIDSTGARAEGAFDSDGTSFNRSLSGVSGEAAGSGRVQWVQVLSPVANDRMVAHSIDRAVDGRPLPDGEPLTFRRIR